jgi:hypothetical protein
MIRAIAAVAAGAAIAAAGITLAVQADSSHHQVSRLTTQLDGIQRQLADDNQNLNRISSDVAGLSTPDDPLSAYDDVCNQPMTTSHGQTETYWFPCTNSATTIPQPGN